jgi:RHS repeat-associated protein
MGGRGTLGGAAGSPQPIEIAALASALKCDIDLIFEYVYNNIEYEPLFGSNKGSLGTLIDQRGSDLDQAQLFTALLGAAGYSSSQINYQYGYIRLYGTNPPSAPGWLGVKNDANAIANLLTGGGIPFAPSFQRNPDGTLAQIDVAHWWVQVQINGVQYIFDPSLKQHTVSTGLSNLAGILGYTQMKFLADAGGTSDSVSVVNLSRVNIHSDLATYAGNLANYIASHNPAWTIRDVVGGKTIQPLTGSPLRQTSLPYLSPPSVQPPGYPQTWGTVPNQYRTCFTISMPGVTGTPCTQPSSQTIQLYSDQTYGHRITVFSVASGSSYIPTLRIDGAPPPNGQDTGTAAGPGQSWKVNVTIQHPYAFTDDDQDKDLTITAGGAYLIGAGWGQVSRSMVDKHRTLLQQARAAGNPDSSELVLGESLAMISYTWLAELASEERVGDALAQVTTQYHHGVGITAQSFIQNNTGTQAPFVDLPANALSIVTQTASSGITPAFLARGFAGAGTASSMESAVLEQVQALLPGAQAASTVRLVDMNASTTAKTFFADGTTTSGIQTYFNSIRGNLTGYSTGTGGDLPTIDCLISSTCQPGGSPRNPPHQVLLPAIGSISVGKWMGAGYTVITATSSSMSISQRISGGLSGGYMGSIVQDAQLANTLQTYTLNVVNQQLDSYPATTLAQSSPGNRVIAEPVDGVTGGYTYQHTDLTTGSAGFPVALPFARSYSSAASTTDIGLGNGWASNYNVSISRNTNGFAGLGESSPISAAAAIAALYVAQDITQNATTTNTNNAQLLTIAWMVSRWMTDQLTNNAMTVAWPGYSEEFIWLPHPDNSAIIDFNSPLGSAAVLIGTVPDQNGNPTAFTYRSKDQALFTFNPLNTASTGQLASWAFPSGMNLSFSYNYSFNNTSFLTSVKNNLGRSLTLAYAGAHVSSVTDDTGRSVGFGYDQNNNLINFLDPLQNQTNFMYDGASRLTQAFYPSNPAVPFVTNFYDGLGRVFQQANAYGKITSFYMALSRTESVDPAGDRHVTYQTPHGRVIKDVWVLNNSFGDIFNDTPQPVQNGLLSVTANQYDGQDRLTQTTAPELGTIQYTYSIDLLHNLTKVVQNPKPGSLLSALTTTFTYDPVYNRPTSVTDPLGYVTTALYERATGNLLSTVADAGSGSHFNATASFTYNAFGQVLSATDPLGTVTQYGYDALGNRTSITRDYGPNRLNQLTMMTYTAPGDIASVTDPNGHVTTSSYDADRRIVTATTPGTSAAPSGLVTSYSYDPDGHLLQTRQSANGAGLRTTGATYTLTGQPATATDANGNVTTYAYDAVDRLASVTDPLGRSTSYAYDPMSRRTAVLNTAIQSNPLLQLGYTPDGLLGALTDANGNSTGFAYDGLDRLAATTYPDNSTEKVLMYDAGGNVLTRQTRASTNQNPQIINYTYDTLNRLSTKTPPSPAPVVTYSYDLAGRLKGVTDTSAAIVAAVPPGGSTVSYATTTTYDSLNRPINTTWSPAPTAVAPAVPGAITFAHTYNGANQRSGQTVTDNSWWYYPAAVAGTTSYASNNLNQYKTVGLISATYDGNGNLAFDGTFTYCYDAENRLTSVVQGMCSSPTSTVATYAFDGQARRKLKTVGTTTTIYVTDADNREVLEYDGASGAIKNWYAYGPGANDALNQLNVTAGTRETFVPDIQGSVLATLDSVTGAFTKTGYLVYGRSNAVPATFGYTGQRADPETNGLYYYRARMYLPAWGRFMQPDPSGYSAGSNLHAYVGNDPLNAIDPFGMRDSPAGSFASTLDLFGRGVVGATMFGPVALPGDIAENPGRYATGAVGAATIAGGVAVLQEVLAGATASAGGAAPTVFAGHGVESALAGTTVVPEGVAVTLPGRAGTMIPDKLGQLIESGNWRAIAENPRFASIMEGSATHLPGATVPNLILQPAGRLATLPGSITVNTDTLLSQLLSNARGVCVWAACRAAP